MSHRRLLCEPLEDRRLLAARVVGYFPDYEFSRFPMIDLSAVTNLNYFSVLGNADGSLTSEDHMDPARLDAVVAAAHANPRRETVSITVDWATPVLDIARDPAALAAFVGNIIQFCSAHSLDGIDLDWEPINPTAADVNTYGSFIEALHAETAPRGLLLSAAVKPDKHMIPLSAVADLDWLAVMDYDLQLGDHADYDLSVQYLNGWADYGVPKDKLLMGVPFYGQDGQSYSAAATYQTIVDDTHPAPGLDQVYDPLADKTWHYNGIATMDRKAHYVVDHGFGGLMIWELGQDHFDAQGHYDQWSLLPAIHNAIVVMDTSGDDVIRIIRNENDATKADVFINNSGPSPSYVLSLTDTVPWQFSGGAGDDELIVDFSRGNPLPTAGLAFDGGTQTSGDRFRIKGTSGNDAVIASATQVTLGQSPIVRYSNIEFFDFELRDGEDSLVVDHAMVCINDAGAISARTAVTISGGSILDMGGKTISVGAVTVRSGSIINGSLAGTSYVVQTGSLSANLFGPSRLVKSGDGTALLSGANSYTGGTRVDAGILEVDRADGLPPGGSLIVGAAVTPSLSSDASRASVQLAANIESRTVAAAVKAPANGPSSPAARRAKSRDAVLHAHTVKPYVEDLAWLQVVDQWSIQSSAKKRASAGAAVDEVLARYWQ